LAYKLALALKETYHTTPKKEAEIREINVFQEQTLFNTVCV